MLAYKGVTLEMSGHGGFTFELGRKYTEPEAKCGRCGFHAGENIFVCWNNNFTPERDRIFIVELGGKIDEKQGTFGKAFAATEITFIRELSYGELMAVMANGGVC